MARWELARKARSFSRWRKGGFGHEVLIRRPSSDLSSSDPEQPVVGLEPDRSDPRMRLKQNWSFQRRRAFAFDCRSGAYGQTRFGDESNQVS